MAEGRRNVLRAFGAKKRFRAFALVLVGLYLAALAGLYVFQREMIYLPGVAQLAAAELALPTHSRFEPFDVTTADGLHLQGLWVPEGGKPLTIVFFHGNADNIRTAAPLMSPFVEAGYGVLVVEYRGYNGLAGQPSEQALYTDARAYIDALKAKGVEERRVVLYGHSLGTGVATQMAIEYPDIAALALAAPYLSVARVAQHRFPIFPAELLTFDRFDNLAKISSVKAPLLVGQGDRDLVIPVAHGRSLFAAAREPKTFRLFPGKGHSDFLEDFNRALMAWLDQRL